MRELPRWRALHFSCGCGSAQGMSSFSWSGGGFSRGNSQHGGVHRNGAWVQQGGFVTFPALRSMSAVRARLAAGPAAASQQQAPREGDGDDDDDDEESEIPQAAADKFRESLEQIVDGDEAKFCGKDLAMIIRKKYGRSYDVQLIKREFMGRQLLAMNVMWKYREQRSFPLSEEEYLLHLDDVANTLKCWGAVSYIRRSIENTKVRPRIGKAVSIFIDLDESGGRANEWINL